MTRLPSDARPDSDVVQMAPAKINLYLHVTGKTDDGYHTLDSLVVFTDISDRVSISNEPAGDDITLCITGPYSDAVPHGEENLVLRAARMLAQHTGIKKGTDIHLEKNLPPSSGIGGGSADAAAALIALSKHWRAELDSSFLDSVARSLGADVPVCLMGSPAFLDGIGDDLDSAPTLPAANLVLVNPGVAVSTPDVFKASSKMRAGPFSDPARFENAPTDAAQLAEMLKARTNDLAGPAISICPEIQHVLDTLEAQNGALLARMSGSGATCFALFASAPEAEKAATAIRSARPKWWVKAARMLD